MKIQPVVRDSATSAFFDGCAEGTFLLRRSKATGEVLSPRAEQDSEGNTDLEWIPASGFGTVVSWAIVPDRGGDPGKETMVGIVELDEGPWWWTQLVDLPPTDVAGELRVEVRFPKSGSDPADEHVPVFVPLGADQIP